ncbi:hypothetical protein HNR26_000003 [Rhizobium rosettiformans]|uniref:Uncharacterized protein n=2 Tax=Rhizobium rosettiformans TaxID=1368430 RepID=A0A7W8HKY9_9HYPH|nr:hypothetical protein [Rhizobium rosettiformans]MBB5273965.1 hypothetical protein [Rhizobium rosettiformans]
MTVAASYTASLLNHANDNRRHRGTNEEMETRARFLIDYAAKHAPVTVRQLFYAATVAGIPGIQKDDNGYNAIQQQVLKLRRTGRMPYRHIADLTRFMRKPRTHSGVAEALEETAALYRRAMWRDLPWHVEVWVEKDALAGCLSPITSRFDVPLMVCRGFTSETFAHEAVETWAEIGKTVQVYHFGDFDRSGQDAAYDLERKLAGFARERGLRVAFERLGVTIEQIQAMDLPTREPKRKTAADMRWPYPFACELDAIPPDELRSILWRQLDAYICEHDLKVLQAAEESERDLLRAFARHAQTI